MQRLVKNLFISTALCAVVALPSSAKADGEIYNKTLKATAWVLAKTDGSTSSGTGVLVDSEKKLLITNFHVVGEARTAVIFFPELKDGKAIVDRNHYLKNVKKLGVRGRVLGVDRKRDLALIELDRLPEGVAAIELAEDSVGTAEQVQSIGNSGSTEALWVHTSGDVRALYRKQFRTGAGEHDFMVVETQSPINPGDSGGPVVNRQGQLIAICQSLAPKARLITYCVDISEVKAFLASDWKRAPLPIADILEKAELKFTKNEKNDVLEVSIENSGDDKDKTREAQTVFVAADVEYYEQADVRKVWSLAATLKEAPSHETTLKLLQESARTKMGGWSIEKADNGDYLVIFVCKVDATATPRALKSTMEYVARLTALAKTDLSPTKSTEDPAEILSSWLSE
ncbi:MAG: serine protease [Planctomycetaceae bacterium]